MIFPGSSEPVQSPSPEPRTTPGKDRPLVVIGSDGRDAAWQNRFYEALIAGLNLAGVEVLDLGTIPTPLVITAIRELGALGGIMLTASHNPSDQNGLKFFVGTTKPLPQEAQGDYTLTAGILQALRNLRSLPGGRIPQVSRKPTPLPRASLAEAVIGSLPRDLPELFAGITVVLDDAQGAYFGLAQETLDRLGITTRRVGAPATGKNINQGCGVAELEGAARIPSQDYHRTIPAVRSCFDLGRQGREAWGFVLDGDGDRGFLLGYDPQGDQVRILGGDVCGYLAAAWWRRRNPERPGRAVCTVESDLGVVQALESGLALSVEVTPVGDRWIAARAGMEDFVVGFESSGHVIIPGDGITAGNGLRTCLLSLYAAKSLGYSPMEIYDPFPRGFELTRYTYFIDKSGFQPGSLVWQEDLQIIRRFISRSKEAGAIAQDVFLSFPTLPDREMIVGELRKEGGKTQGRVGTVICRNSGTEDKCAVYLKAVADLGPVLVPLADLLERNHRTLKDPDRPEVRAEALILGELEKQGGTPSLAVQRCRELHRSCITPGRWSETGFRAFLHALSRQGHIQITPTTLEKRG